MSFVHFNRVENKKKGRDAVRKMCLMIKMNEIVTTKKSSLFKQQQKNTDNAER